MSYRNFKRIADFGFSLLALILLSPIILLVILCLSIVNQGTPFFLQDRPGKDEKIFKVIKFKTMNDKKDPEGNLLSDEQRMTRVGKTIRKTSVDEIPQLINVVLGQMSFVGPRPLLPEYLDLYSDEQKLRHQVRPGITGWAQVNGRNAISWTKKLELDVWYVKNKSFGLDLRILFKTVIKIIQASDINTEGMATTERFTGFN